MQKLQIHVESMPSSFLCKVFRFKVLRNLRMKTKLLGVFDFLFDNTTGVGKIQKVQKFNLISPIERFCRTIKTVCASFYAEAYEEVYLIFLASQ